MKIKPWWEVEHVIVKNARIKKFFGIVARILGVAVTVWAFALLCICLHGCGGGGSTPESSYVPSDFTWEGGLWDVYPAEGDQFRGVVIVHQGHCPFDYGQLSLVLFARLLASLGFEVICVEMPMTPHGPPIEQYYQAVLDIIDGIPDGTPIFMVGLSGGGWATTICQYLSDRIIMGYSVAGDIPLDMRYPGQGDWEQWNPPAPYREMYATGRITHIFLLRDPPGGFAYTGWSEEEFGGPFWVDEEANGHYISEWAQKRIIEDILSF